MSGAETYGRRSAKPQTKSLEHPDETLTFPKGAASNVRLGDLVVGRLVQQPGWRWSEQVKPIAKTESCQFHHVGVALSGGAMIRMDDGTEMAINPGDVFDIPPGHDQWVTSDEPAVSIIWGGWRGFGKQPVGDRVLTTMLMTDIAGSTDRAAQMGDAAWDQADGPAQRAGARRDRAVSRAGDRHHRRRLPDRVRWRRTGAAGGRGHPRCRGKRSAWRSMPGFTPAKWSWCRATSAAWPSTRPPASWRWRARARSWCRAPRRSSSRRPGVTFEDRGRHVLKGVPGERQVYAANVGG